MKIAVNRCYGGFQLSPLALKKIAKKKGQEIYFFEGIFDDKNPITEEEAFKNKLSFISAYTIPNPDFERMHTIGEDGTYREANEYADSISYENSPRDEERADKILIEVIEELGEKASGPLAQIEIVEIPDDVKDWYIDEYDGVETVREGRSW